MTTDDETSSGFLDHVGQALKTCEGVDAELAGILVQHILSPAPAEDCVEQAMKAINALAVARIAPPEGGADG